MNDNRINYGFWYVLHWNIREFDSSLNMYIVSVQIILIILASKFLKWHGNIINVIIVATLIWSFGLD